MHRFIKIITFTGLISCCITGFAKHHSISADVGFVQKDNLPAGSASISPIRLKALKEAATELGARGALAWRSLQIDQSLKKQARYLDHVFDFNQLLINGNVLPPVITQGDDSLNVDNPEAIRAASKIYRIVSPARFASTPPTWRDYLWMNYAKPTLPDRSLLPQTQAEANVWNSYLKQGWRQGLRQADAIFSVNLNRLKRDYNGIALYRKLLQQRMISAPFIAHTNLGVTGDSHEIRINDRVSRITDQSKLQPDSLQWRPVIRKEGIHITK